MRHCSGRLCIIALNADNRLALWAIKINPREARFANTDTPCYNRPLNLSYTRSDNHLPASLYRAYNTVQENHP